jgi:hypothetical protein
MHKKIKHGLVALASLGLGATAFAAPAVAPTSTPLAPVTASADGFGHNAVIKYKRGQRSYLYVCHQFTGSYPGSCYDGGSNKKDLLRGRNTKTAFGWSDSDGFYLPGGYDAWTVGIANGHHFKATGWKKINGCGGCTVSVTLVGDGEGPLG